MPSQNSRLDGKDFLNSNTTTLLNQNSVFSNESGKYPEINFGPEILEQAERALVESQNQYRPPQWIQDQLDSAQNRSWYGNIAADLSFGMLGESEFYLETLVEELPAYKQLEHDWYHGRGNVPPYLGIAKDSVFSKSRAMKRQLVDQAFKTYEFVGYVAGASHLMKSTRIYLRAGATSSLVENGGGRLILARSNVPRMLRPNTTRGWKVGDPTNNLTRAGNVPSWSTVRQRFWKNEALYNTKNYDPFNLARMKKGLAPQRINPQTGKLESMELHHTPPQREGGLFNVEPMWPNDHYLIDPFRHTGN